MYQWEEYTTNNDGYQYRKIGIVLINSDNFEKIEHKNPKSSNMNPKISMRKILDLGDFTCQKTS